MSTASAKRGTRDEILEVSVSLFSQHGFDGVSVRDVAAGVGLTPAALYYHFPDKEQLYVAAVAYAFREQAPMLLCSLQGPGAAWQRLEAFVHANARLLASDRNFLRLVQWVQLDGDIERQHKLAVQVFKDIYVAIHDLAAELDSSRDPHLLAVSIIALVNFPYQSGAGRQFLPGYHPQLDEPDVLARHVFGLLKACLGKAATP